MGKHSLNQQRQPLGGLSYILERGWDQEIVPTICLATSKQISISSQLGL